VLLAVGVKKRSDGVHLAIMLREVLPCVLKMRIARLDEHELRGNADVLLRLVNSDGLVERQSIAAGEMNAVARRPDHDIISRKVARCDKHSGEDGGEKLHGDLASNQTEISRGRGWWLTEWPSNGSGPSASSIG